MLCQVSRGVNLEHIHLLHCHVSILDKRSKRFVVGFGGHHVRIILSFHPSQLCLERTQEMLRFIALSLSRIGTQKCFGVLPSLKNDIETAPSQESGPCLFLTWG